VIPAEAVEAALKVSGGTVLTIMNEKANVRRILEAAAPHMLADLRAELVKLAKEFDSAEGGTLAYTTIIDGFGMRKNAHDTLMYVIDNHMNPAP
jgi:hypothetical protein